MYASTDNRPNAIIASRPGTPDDFRKTNPPVDNDAFDIEIFDTQVSRIYWLKSMPGGLLIGSNAGVMQLTGGNSNAGNPVGGVGSNAVIVPQTFFGTADIVPALIDKEVLYVQREGTVRDLTYNFYANIYAGNDLACAVQSSVHRSRGSSIGHMRTAQQDRVGDAGQRDVSVTDLSQSAGESRAGRGTTRSAVRREHLYHSGG